MELTELLVEIRRRARVLPAADVDPIEEIMHRIATNPHTTENRTLARIAGAIGMGHEVFRETEIWSLSPEALGLLDALIEGRLAVAVRTES